MRSGVHRIILTSLDSPAQAHENLRLTEDECPESPAQLAWDTGMVWLRVAVALLATVCTAWAAQRAVQPAISDHSLEPPYLRAFGDQRGCECGCTGVP